MDIDNLIDCGCHRHKVISKADMIKVIKELKKPTGDQAFDKETGFVADKMIEVGKAMGHFDDADLGD